MKNCKHCEAEELIKSYGGLAEAKAYMTRYTTRQLEVSMFKVGDKVVRRGGIHYVSKSFSLWEVVSVLQTTIPCIEAAPLTRNGKIVHARVGVYAQQQFDHATPEEIKAGHRIDTNTGVTVITPSGINKVKGGMTAFVDMGDDSHIENHISKNCKVIEHEAE